MSHSNLKQIYIVLTSLLLYTSGKNIDKPTTVAIDKIITRQVETLVSQTQIEETTEKKDVVAKDNYDKENEEKLKKLEEEKKELFERLNKAIDSAIQSLQEIRNDSSASEGIGHMTKLKEQIKQLNDIDNREPSGTRRNAPGVEADEMTQGLLLRSMWEVSNRDKNHKPNKKREQHRLDVQKRLDSWLENRIKTKQEKKEREIRLGKEDCPRYGRKGSGSKGKKSKDKKGRGKRMPCCKKCCKQSILKCF